ncbi:hypothetical protein Poli38472_000391 [Pythium oligandrum]|uniref:Tetraspanin n=1 Tax=Pythium oligandrum TaxID=41045 RepID=A0A8K1CC75_PYTOL|nr:hypothetical protein Poli38472_000391 [Pythium oligandrum]|eukprot:TMW60349.1 hypothetical protein Poli38472_000391 [Pythium oligandrum]
MGIFAKESLVQFMAGAGCFSVVRVALHVQLTIVKTHNCLVQIQMLVLVILGAHLVANQHYHQLLSNSVKHAGGGLIFTGILYILSALLGFYSARSQNKFLLLMNFLLLSILVFLQVMFGGIAVGETTPYYSFAFQEACLTVSGYEQMSFPDQELCEKFFQHDNFAGMSLVWQSYYTKSVSDGSYRAMVLNFQKEHFCCGNGLPMHCVNDSRPFPSTYPDPVVWKQRRICDSKVASSYPATKECRVNGRCEYELPNGLCGANPVTSTSRGCGAYVFQKLSNEVAAIGAVALALVMFPIIFIIGTVCLCFKRRDEDVMPSIDFVSKVKIYIDG